MRDGASGTFQLQRLDQEMYRRGLFTGTTSKHARFTYMWESDSDTNWHRITTGVEGEPDSWDTVGHEVGCSYCSNTDDSGG